MKKLSINDVTANLEDYTLNQPISKSNETETFDPNKNYFQAYLNLKEENEALRKKVELLERNYFAESHASESYSPDNACSPNYSSCNPHKF